MKRVEPNGQEVEIRKVGKISRFQTVDPRPIGPKVQSLHVGQMFPSHGGATVHALALPAKRFEQFETHHLSAVADAFPDRGVDHNVLCRTQRVSGSLRRRRQANRECLSRRLDVGIVADGQLHVDRL